MNKRVKFQFEDSRFDRLTLGGEITFLACVSVGIEDVVFAREAKNNFPALLSIVVRFRMLGPLGVRLELACPNIWSALMAITFLEEPLRPETCNRFIPMCCALVRFKASLPASEKEP